MSSKFVLVQISDPHFGDNLRNARASRVHSGYNRHNVQLCHALDQMLIEDIYALPGISPNDTFHLLMGGDLVARGVKEEFDTAHSYLFAINTIHENGVMSELGLEHPTDLYWSVAGNHDHWHGKFVYPIQRGYSKALFPQYFEDAPWVHPIQQGRLELVLCGLDSNSMFEGSKVNLNPGAGGGFSKDHRDSFEQQIQAAMAAPLPKGCTRRTSLILCHHPLSQDGAAGPLRDDCVDWLLGVAADCDVPFIFTGHTHRMWTDFMVVRTDNSVKVVREIRSPTTLRVLSVSVPDCLGV